MCVVFSLCPLYFDRETFAQDNVRSIAFLPGNSQLIVTGSNDRSVRVWDTQSGVCQLRLQGNMDWVRGVDASQTGNFLATASKEGRATVWKYELPVT